MMLTTVHCPECGVEVRAAMARCRTCGAVLKRDDAAATPAPKRPNGTMTSASSGHASSGHASQPPRPAAPLTNSPRGRDLLNEVLQEAQEAGLEVRSVAGQRPAVVEQVHQALADGDAAPLLPLLEHEDERVRKLAVQALGRLTDPISVGPLYRRLREESSEEVRIVMVTAMSRFKDASVLMAIAYALDQPEPLRLKAILALGGIPGTHARELLIRQMTSESPLDRCYVAQAFARTEDAAMIPFLETMFRSGEPIVKRSALKALRDLGDTRSEEELSKPPAVSEGPKQKRWWRRTRKQAQLEAPEKSKAETIPADDEEADVPESPQPQARVEPKPEKPKKPKRPRVKASSPLTRLRNTEFSRYDLMPSFLLGLPSQAQTIAAAVLIVSVIAGGVGVWAIPGMMAGDHAIVRGTVTSLSFSDDGGKLAAGRSFGLVELWDVADQELDDQITQIAGERIVLNPAGTRMLAATNQRTVLYDLETETILAEEAGSRALSASSAGSHVVASSADGRLLVWNLESGAVEGSFSFDRDDISAIAVSNDGARLAVAAGAGEVYEVGLSSASPEMLREIVVPGGSPVTSLAYDPGGVQLVVATRNGPILIWEGDQPQPGITLENPEPGFLKEVRYTASGRLVGIRKMGVDLWNVAAEEVVSFPVDLERVDSIAVSQDGGTIACGSSEDPQILLFDASGNVTGTLNVE
ncbi:MAG: hypothetical protein DWQ34_05695 [Planctomycetota bacterium]|nr:MAG: hypothetical protein DWQ29_03885 [Planctomycetota bacterium]REJ95539.1 MAG: hypothetical protein DWQ34_05695 [Planctomycetota bacterium]REK21925.1 MAG: hypothetical protein DWQ41_20165 [Planctomycetota bacterium]REK32163.1 MAG: hypothetical protein DWQ45_17630 [Planctomycetota bacterium]